MANGGSAWDILSGITGVADQFDALYEEAYEVRRSCRELRMALHQFYQSINLDARAKEVYDESEKAEKRWQAKVAKYKAEIKEDHDLEMDSGDELSEEDLNMMRRTGQRIQGDVREWMELMDILWKEYDVVLEEEKKVVQALEKYGPLEAYRGFV